MKILWVFIFVCSFNLSLGEDYSDLLDGITQKFQEKLKETEVRLELKLQEEIARRDEHLIQLESKLEAELAKRDEQIYSKLKDIVRDEINKYFAENEGMVTANENQNFEELSNSVHYIKNKELIDASANGRIEDVKRLVADGVDTNWKNHDGKSSLRLAAWGGHQEVVRILLAYGADINSTNSLLLGMRDLEMLKLLLENGANVDEIYFQGRHSSLTWSVMFNQTEKVKVLLEFGANVHFKDTKGNTILMKATSAEIAQILLTSGADVNAKNNQGNTSLMNAESAEVVQILLSNGADVNAKNNQGNTSLMNAKSAEVAQILLSNGADVNAKNNEGKTALDQARNKDIRKILKQNGAKKGKDIN